MSRRLRVDLHGETVGHLTESDNGTRFAFTQDYLRHSRRPVLGQRFEDDLERIYTSRKGRPLPDFFANLIPEGRLREVIERRAGLERGDDLGLLQFAGGDLPGAVHVSVGKDETGSPRETAELGLDDSIDTDIPADQLRFSVAGVQLKFSMLVDGDKLTLPMRGAGGSWIVKLDSPVYPHLAENEYSMLTWAREAGFNTPDVHLHERSRLAPNVRVLAPRGSRVLAVARYDRHPDGPIHQEDFAQAVGLPPDQKYDHLTFDVMARLVRGFIAEEAVHELVRRLVLMVAAGNNDAHLKNWSLIYPNRIRAAWSPVYDQVATVAWPEPDRKLALKLGGVKSFGRIDREAFGRFADRAHLDRARVLDLIDQTLERLASAWQTIGAELPLVASHRDALADHWRRVPLLAALRGLKA